MKDILIAILEGIKVLLLGQKEVPEINIVNFEEPIEQPVYHIEIEFPAIYRNIPAKDLENFIQTKLKDIKSLNYIDITVYGAMGEMQWNDHEINMLLRYNKTKKKPFPFLSLIVPLLAEHFQ